MRLLIQLEKTYAFWFLLSLSVVFFFLRLPSLAEPYWYGDEGIYHAIGLALRDGRVLYSEIWDNKPPLLYFIYSLLSSNQFSIRLVSLLSGIVSIWIFYMLAVKIFVQRKSAIFTTSLFMMLFALPVLEGNIANAENFMLLPIIGAAYLFYSITTSKVHHQNLWLFFGSGLLLGIAFLFKIVALFDFIAFLLFYLFLIKSPTHLKGIAFFTFYLRQFKEKQIQYYIGGFLLPFFFSLLFFLTQGSFSDYMSALVFQNVSYVGRDNAFIFPQGLLIIKMLILASGIIFLYRYRHAMQNSVLFILLWILFALFNAHFSGRVYTHYLLVFLPSFCLGIGLFKLIPQYTKRLAIGLVVILLLLAFNFDFYMIRKTIPYYGNYLQFISSNKSIDAYYSFFDSNTPRDYALAQYLKRHMSDQDRVFLWGDNPQVYTLANTIPPGKYTVAYHIITERAISETYASLQKVKPKYFVIFPNTLSVPFSLSNYRYLATIQDTSIYERIN